MFVMLTNLKFKTQNLLSVFIFLRNFANHIKISAKEIGTNLHYKWLGVRNDAIDISE